MINTNKIRRSEGSPYRNFLLYVEEIYQVTVDIPLKYYEYFKSYKKKDIDNKNLKQFCNIIKEQHEINNEQQKCFCCYCRQDDMQSLNVTRKVTINIYALTFLILGCIYIVIHIIKH
ncbi:hypothetical protein PFAG_02053 [Plasmodium falciparum Santa Lucia]|uniref:Uncharacterized protein n=1 Tax=Plasmodium falciparum Santa Lucia TaxID=478859 RepID=W7G044_PLAFA|nr:hypothetical protein PFAG_02053 [Plasmodium falciparum Santa Lucia]